MKHPRVFYKGHWWLATQCGGMSIKEHYEIMTGPGDAALKGRGCCHRHRKEDSRSRKGSDAMLTKEGQDK